MSSQRKTDLFATPPYCKKIDRGEESSEADCGNGAAALKKLEVSNPAKLLDLCESLTERSTKQLEVKINGYLRPETDSTKVFLINLLNVSEEAVIQVVQDKILSSSIRTSLSDDSIKNLVTFKEGAVKCTEALDSKINELVKKVVPENSGELVLVPVMGRAQKERSASSTWPVYMACFLNPSKETYYISKLVNETFSYCLTLLLNTRDYESEKRLKHQCQSLLLVARKLFSHLSDLSDLLKEIMSEARRLTNAERCSLFLLDPDHMHLVAKVFDGVSPAEKNTEVRIAKDQGIAGHVAATGQLLNIKDAYKHPLFYKGVDEATGFKTRNILCFPIRDEDSIVGVAQLCNKIQGNFDYFDEQVANAFSIYCGISIMHSLVYKQIQDAQARSQLSNELMMYHMQVSDQDVADVVMCQNSHDWPYFNDFSFVPRKVLLKETPCFVLKMFRDLGFIEYFRIKVDTLTRFILYVRKGYRDLPYHNWSHAFSVAHFAYLCLTNFQLVENGYMTKLEALSYLVSCLCHDIDHRGTTNSFQQQSNSVLASLYSSEGSVMERHHLSQTLCTLNTQGCNFLETLSREDYTKCLDYLKNMVLATDLALHYKIHARQLLMAETGYEKSNPEHRYYLCSLLMTCADLSDQTKDWAETKKVAQLIYAEFFTQGDMEKKMGRKPANMMDREKASIPDHQVEFLTEVVICIFRILAIMFPSAKVLVDAIKTNIRCWEASKAVFVKFALEGKTSYDILISDELETEIRNALHAEHE